MEDSGRLRMPEGNGPFLSEQTTEEPIARERLVFWKAFSENKTAVAGLLVVIAILFIAIFAGVLVDYHTEVIAQNVVNRLQPPSAGHWFGTDGYGRDFFARIIYGSRTTLGIAFFTTFISCLIGGILGVTAGYFGGVYDSVLMRVVDVVLCLPPLLFSLAIVAALGTGAEKLIIAVSIAMAPYFTRIIRSAVLTVVSADYVESAKASGASDLRIMLTHIIPNCLGPIIVEATMNLSSMIMISAGLSFIGLGVQPPSPEWGAMLNEGREYMRELPYIVIFPGISLILTALSFNLLGDGLRDALDPRLRS